MKSKPVLALPLFAVLLSACSATSSPEAGPSAKTSPTYAICDGPTNTPMSSPSMMPTESGAPSETDAIVRFTPGFEAVDPVDCRGALATLVNSPQFATMSGDHIEVGTAARGLCAEAKDRPSYACWKIEFYDYETRAGYQASVSNDGAAILPQPGGVPPSPEEASAAAVVALADPAVTKALSSGSWTPWLYESSPGSDSSPCRTERCISLRAWNTASDLMAVVVNLHRHSIESSDLP